jgi:hypothetical protein
MPGHLKLDTAKTCGLLVKATEAALPVLAWMNDKLVSAERATASIALMEVLDAVIKTVILPMAG